MHAVLVVGGGIAGMTAARDLAHCGYGVVVLEARDRLGGRTWWKRCADTDHHAEMGGTWFDEGTQHNIAREIRRYYRAPDPRAARCRNSPSQRLGPSGRGY